MCDHTVELERTFSTSIHLSNQLSEEEKQYFVEYVQSIVHKQVN